MDFTPTRRHARGSSSSQGKAPSTSVATAVVALGKRLKYPITIGKLLKKPGDRVEKQQPVLQYSFTWLQEVGDPFAETWKEKQTSIADWESPTDGKLVKWMVHEGQVVEKDTGCMEIEETCSHSVQFAGLCAVCGKDMNERSWVTESTDSDRAVINMIHDQTLLAVSRDEASRAEAQLQRRLLKHRKLSLVVDLDQTIIHACIEPTIGEWQRDLTSPNYETVKDVKAFQLNDDGPRGLALGCWYYIKMRPGLKEFLFRIVEMYELHVYTMGTRAYAQNIANIVDPEHKLFGDRIISRDESGSLTAKTLSRLFPVDTKMVVIIDDRSDVWPKNRPNLIKVVPYDFFVGIGDINSSFLPKRQDVPRATQVIKLRIPDKSYKSAEANVDTTKNDENNQGDKNGGKKFSTEEIADGIDRISALEELVSMGGGDDPAIRRIQAEEQEEFLEKQLKERPLLHMQQELDKEDNETLTQSSNGESDEATKNGEEAAGHPQHRHHLLKDDDKELIYLEAHLTNVHKAFYDEYDRTLPSAQGGRVAHLRPGQSKKMSLGDGAANLKLVPDIAEVMPRLKAKTLTGITIVLSGLVPLGVDVMRYGPDYNVGYFEYVLSHKILRRRSEIVQQAISFGAQVQTRVSRKVTHVVVSANRARTQKVRQAAKFPHIHIVNQQWLMDSMSKWQKEDEEQYLIQVHRDDKANSSEPQSIHSSDDSFGSGSDDDDDDDDDEILHSSEYVPEGVIPDELEDPLSPIDNLQHFDWSSADAELEEFMAERSDGEGDSDCDSLTSGCSDQSQTSRLSVRGRKHPRNDTDEETDEESSLAKKQRLARGRTTSLKAIKTPNSVNSKSSLPTPDVTAGEEWDFGSDVDQLGADDDLDDELEAQMLAEFAKEDFAEQQGWNGYEDEVGGEAGHDVSA